MYSHPLSNLINRLRTTVAEWAHRLGHWLAHGHTTEVADLDAYRKVMDPAPDSEADDLRIQIRCQMSKMPRSSVDIVIGRFGGPLDYIPDGQLRLVLESLIRRHEHDQLKPLHEMQRHGRVSGHINRRSDTSCYEVIMSHFQPHLIFGADEARQWLVALGYSQTSHGPALSDLTQLGHVINLGDGAFGFGPDPLPRRFNWMIERARLKQMRDVRRVRGA